MTNEDYARKICCSGCNNYVCYTNKKRCPTLEDLLTMAEWKDEQHAKEKQQLINKLEDWLANNICNAYNFRGDDISETFMNDCIKAMKGE